MTFGKKIATLRKRANMTQNDLAVSLNVSRQAITKWENDIGLPDIDNLIKLASLFNTTVDDLINYKVEDIVLEENVVTETIDKQNSKLKNVNNFILQRFNKAESIYQLSRTVKLTFWQNVLDFFIGAGTLEIADYLKAGLFFSYLVECSGAQYLVLINKNKMLTKRLNQKFNNKMVIDGYMYKINKNSKLK